MRAWVAVIGVLLSGAALAEGFGIMAVVDDQAVSSVDVNERLALVMGMANIPDSPETRSKLAPQILRQLIDEKLQLAEAQRDGITISDPKLREGLARIEQQSGKAPGSLEQFVQSKGLSQLSLYAQVRAQLAWTEVVLKKIRPRIKISDREIAGYVKKKPPSPSLAAAPAAEPEGKIREVKIAVIHLPVDAPKHEASIRKTAEKLVSAIRAGASFEAVASQFSSHTGGPKATTAFWVEASQVDPAIARALAHTPKDGVTDPVRTVTGYQIIRLADLRRAAPAKQEGKAAAAPESEAAQPRAELAFKQILMTLKPDARPVEAELLLKLAKSVQQAPGRCEEKKMAGAGDLADMDFRVTFARAVSSDMPEKLRDFLMKLKVGEASDPVITPQGIRLFMLCERIDLGPASAASAAEEETLSSPDSAKQAIYAEKMELEAQKFMRDLRREAFIEIRGGE